MQYHLLPPLALLLTAGLFSPAVAQSASTRSPTKRTSDSAVAAPKPAPSAEGNANTGKQLFNSILGCSHCHGVNSVGHTDNRNLRELKKRRSDEWEQVFARVMKEGRSGTAMPPWSHLSPKQVVDIKAFLLSIQEE